MKVDGEGARPQTSFSTLQNLDQNLELGIEEGTLCTEWKALSGNKIDWSRLSYRVEYIFAMRSVVEQLGDIIDQALAADSPGRSWRRG